MKIINLDSDKVGITSSLLCLIHCIITPIIFISESQVSFYLKSYPILFWYFFNLIFIIISILAVYHSYKKTTKPLIGYFLWLSCFILLGTIINETFEIIHINEYLNYSAPLLLGSLHLYNQKYCRCDKNNFYI